MRLAIRRLDPAARLPTRAHDGDAGFDLYALEAGTIATGERAAVATGIAIELPERHAGLVLPRSGLAAAGRECAGREWGRPTRRRGWEGA